MEATVTTSSCYLKRAVSAEEDDQNKVASESGKRCKPDDLEKHAISPDSAKETETTNDPQVETDHETDSAKSGPSGSTTNDSPAETDDDDDDDDDEDAHTPRSDKEAIVFIVAKRLWSDDFEKTAAALVLLCKLTKPGFNNRDENLKTAFICGAPLLIAHVMSMNRNHYEIQKNACIALARLANVKIDNGAQQAIVHIGGLKLCRRAADKYEDCPIVQAYVCILIGYLLECPHVREHAVTEGLPTVLKIMNNNKKDGSVQREGCLALYRLVKQNLQLVGAKEAVSGGAIEHLISAMENFPEDADIQTYGCKFLSCIHKDYRDRIIEAKSLIVIAEAGRIHKDNQTVFTAARHAVQVLFFY